MQLLQARRPALCVAKISSRMFLARRALRPVSVALAGSGPRRAPVRVHLTIATLDSASLALPCLAEALSLGPSALRPMSLPHPMPLLSQIVLAAVRMMRIGSTQVVMGSQRSSIAT